MGHVSLGTRERPAERSLAPVVPIRNEAKIVDVDLRRPNEGGNGSPVNGKAAKKSPISVENFLQELEKVDYLKGGGSVQNGEIVIYGKNWRDALYKAVDRGSEIAESDHEWDYAAKDAAWAVKAISTDGLARVRKRAAEIVERKLKGIPGLQHETLVMAKSDAVILASLIELRGSKMDKWQEHYNTMVANHEVWKSGRARLAVVRGKQISYEVREEKAEDCQI
ncbi:MAG: hypothetical protein KGH94_00995 [Candidatus Micrarchaeota archaeon]|nr:hypothetical protein [Candidatus Micrarchaeota archaeon]